MRTLPVLYLSLFGWCDDAMLLKYCEPTHTRQCSLALTTCKEGFGTRRRQRSTQPAPSAHNLAPTDAHWRASHQRPLMPLARPGVVHRVWALENKPPALVLVPDGTGRGVLHDLGATPHGSVIADQPELLDRLPRQRRARRGCLLWQRLQWGRATCVLRWHCGRGR